MKYYITIILFALLLFLGSLMEYPLIVYVVLVILIIGILFLWEYSVFKQNISGDFQMQSHRKSFDIFNLVIALLWTVMIMLNLYGDTDYSSFVICFLILLWGNQLIDFLMYFIYKKEKPVTVCIKDSELILNNRWLQKRDLNTLIQIKNRRLETN